MGKTRDLFKKIRDTKGTFYAMMGSIKGRNCMDLTDAEDIKKRWQKYKEVYKKIGDIKGTIHARMGTINDRNGKYIKETETVNRRWQEYTEEPYKKDLNDP